MLGRGQAVVLQGFEEIEKTLPFRLVGIDSDNGSEFINWHLGAWCAQRKIQFTRGRPYKKDDNAHVEQKNWTRRGGEASGLGPLRLARSGRDLYRNELRLC